MYIKMRNVEKFISLVLRLNFPVANKRHGRKVNKEIDSDKL